MAAVTDAHSNVRTTGRTLQSRWIKQAVQEESPRKGSSLRVRVDVHGRTQPLRRRLPTSPSHVL